MAASHAPARTYADYDAMLADPDVDAIIVATSDAFHVPATLKAVRAGKHVLVEKPLGVSVEEAEALREAVAGAGVHVQVAHMKRFDLGIVSARDFIRGEIGELLAIKAWYCDSTHRYTNTDAVQPIPLTSKSARKPETDPKADLKAYYMLAHGSHLIDTARFLAGEIVRVRARLVEKFGAYCWFVETEFENGCNGHLDLTVAVRMDWHEGFQVYGEHGSVIGKAFNPWYFRASEVDCFSERDATYHRVLGPDGHFYRRQVEGLADTILKGVPLAGATIADGIADTRVMAAIARSVRTGQTVAPADVAGDV